MHDRKGRLDQKYRTNGGILEIRLGRGKYDTVTPEDLKLAYKFLLLRAKLYKRRILINERTQRQQAFAARLKKLEGQAKLEITEQLIEQEQFHFLGEFGRKATLLNIHNIIGLLKD